MFLAALFIIAKEWKQPKYPSKDDWIKKIYLSISIYRRPGFNSWVGKILRRREWLPTPVFLFGETCGQRSLADFSPWGSKEWDTTEQHTHNEILLSHRR